MKEITVSVLIITYNHEKYIAEAIESVLRQKCQFNYEIVIAEDCSTDNTRNILLEYKRKYPELIELFLREVNLGPTRNYVEAVKKCNGKYIAILEGDDYWIDDNKLQIQTEFLENNLEYSACFHAANVIYENKKKTGRVPTDMARDLESLEDYFSLEYGIPTASVVYRKYEVTPDLEKLLTTSSFIGDYVIDAINIGKGKMKYFDRIMSVYRRTMSTTCFSSRSKEKNNLELLEIFDQLDKYFNGKYRRLIAQRKIPCYFALLKIALKSMQIRKAVSIYKEIRKEYSLQA